MPLQLAVVPAFDFDRVSFEKDTEVHLDVVLTAPERLEQKRIPLHLILAVDCSGSMDGNKLPQVKSTINKLVDHLTENDTLGIIKFSQAAWEVLGAIPMTGENKTLAKSKVNEIYSMGSTNLSAAMEMAFEKAVISDRTKTARVILLTDGLPSAGDCNKENLLELAGNTPASLSISCFGYGDDFDAELMTSISRMGRGNNFYIKSDEDCNSAFALELGGLLSLFGQNIQISIKPSGNMTFKEMLSEYKCAQVQGFRLLTQERIDIKIDDIYVGESKHCILKLEIPKATEAVCARPTSVCAIEIKYTDTATQQEQTLTQTAKIQYVRANKVASEPNIDVKKQLMILEAVKLQKEAKAKADTGDFAGARGMLNEAANFCVLNSAFIPNSESYVTAFNEMSSNFSDRNTYRSKGVRMSEAFNYTASTGRISSMGNVGIGVQTPSQRIHLQSFASGAPGTSANSPIIPEKKDPEEQV